MNKKLNPFDQEKHIKILRRNRIAKNYIKYNFLKKHALKDFIYKFKNINKNFDLTLEIGTHSGELTKEISSFDNVKKSVASDISIEMIRSVDEKGILKINFDEERIPFKENVFDGVFSCLYFSNSNNFSKVMLKLQKILKNKGFLLISVFGQKTLTELKKVFSETEINLLNGISPRINNFFDIKGLGDLIFSLGFANPVVETELITVKYPSIYKLMRDLRGMGETNVMIGRRKKFDSMSFFAEAEKSYFLKSESQDEIMATFEIITASCWVNKK